MRISVEEKVSAVSATTAIIATIITAIASATPRSFLLSFIFLILDFIAFPPLVGNLSGDARFVVDVGNAAQLADFSARPEISSFDFYFFQGRVQIRDFYL